MATWAEVSSKLGNITNKARLIAYEVWLAATAAGVDVWFIWGDGNTMDHMLNHTQGKPVLDFMIRNKAGGTWVRNYCWAHRDRLGLRHAIWDHHITSTVVSPGVVRLMEDRGSPTANHEDHVHGEWAAGTYVPPEGEDMADGLETWTQNEHTWALSLRVEETLNRVKALADKADEILARPAVEPAPIDAASLAAAMQDPAVRAAIVAAVNEAEDS